jgi:hypothetical protein
MIHVGEKKDLQLLINKGAVSPINLTGATGVLKIQNPNGVTASVVPTAVTADPDPSYRSDLAPGHYFAYTTLATDFPSPGVYIFQLFVTMPTGRLIECDEAPQNVLPSL